MRWSVVTACFGLLVVSVEGIGTAVAQDGSRPALSANESAAVSRLVESVASKEGDALRQDVVSVIDDLTRNGTDPVGVMRAVKTSAGAKLPALQAVLVGQCVSAGGAGSDYCRLASLQVTSTEVESIATAATGEGAAPGAAAGFGGAAQTNGGGNRGASTSSSGPIAVGRTGGGALTFNLPSFPSVQGTGGGLGTTTSSFVVTGVPGPVAGAGLPVLLAALEVLRRRRRARREVTSK